MKTEAEKLNPALDITAEERLETEKELQKREDDSSLKDALNYVIDAKADIQFGSDGQEYVRIS